MASLPDFDTAEEIPVDGEAMSEEELVSLCGQFEAQAVGTEWDEISAEQARAIEYYYRRMPDLPAEEGSSSVVDGTVAMVIDNALAAILKPFVSADDVVSFVPRQAEDVEQAEQATEFVNYVFNSDNPGFLILHNWFKDALLTKLGIIKIWWEDTSHERPQQATVDAIGLMEARDHEGYMDEADNGDGTYSVTINEMVPDGRIRVAVVPPEEFKIAPFARDIETAPYAAHHPRNVTRSDLIEMGFDAEIVEGLAAYSSDGSEESRSEARYQDEGMGGRDRSLGSPHSSQELMALREEYIRVDYDGDGIAELRKVMRVNDVLLLNEEVEESPFAILCPVPMPHKVYGLSLADQTMDLQRISSVLWRQMLDNLYKANNPRPIVPEGSERQDGSTIDSLIDNSPGAAIYEGRTPIRFEAVPFFAEKSFPMLEYAQQQQEERTGISRAGQGLDSNALKKSGQMTATEMAMIASGKNARTEMIARIFAETGVKRLFKLILKMLVRHQPKERMIRLRNKWVEIDPRGWDAEMDLDIAVGLGVGERSEQIAQADSVIETMAMLVQSPFASLVDAEKAYNAVKRKYHATGIKNVDDFLVEPGEVADQPEQPDPEMMKVQAELQIKTAEMEGKREEAALNLQLKQQESAAKIELMRAEAAAKLDLERARAASEEALALRQQDFEMEQSRAQFALQREQAEHKASLAETAMTKNRPGGDLDK